MAVVQAKPELVQAAPQVPRVDERLMKPGKYEITKDTTFTVDIHLRLKDGRWLIMTGPGKGIDSHKAVFRMWTYDEMVELKKMAMSYDVNKRMHTMDQDALNRFKVQRFLMSWTFDKDNPRLKIHHVGGIMTDESWKAFVELQPNISTYILDEMNKVYEFNG